MAHQGSAAAEPGSSQDTELSLALRLRQRKFVGEDAVAAIHGKRVPLHLGRLLVRLCVVRGIRHHFEFATGDAAVLRGALPMFTTALNARLIMSNQIPDIKTVDEIPYCFWYPDLPSEETLRELVARYPDTRYQVGRTCAVAGYTALYESLDVLPEVAIAEEARESGSLEIFERIIREPVKWRVFDDYTGTLCTPTPGCLNGDTLTYSRLNYRQGFRKPSGRAEGEEGDPEPGDPTEDDDDWNFSIWDLLDDPGYRPVTQNVTGDHGLDAPERWADMPRFIAYPPKSYQVLSQTALDLLSKPLPVDLPTCDKEVLIVMAAYRGDIDRYCRLRRPHLVCNEYEAIIRGIYHNAQFAKWWSAQPPPNPESGASGIATAIVARFIMNDDISWALKVGRGGFGLWQPHHPYQICYPDIAWPSTYEALARAIPAMRPAVARAAIHADYKAVFDLVVTGPSDEFEIISPDGSLYAEALQSPQLYYRETLEKIAREKGIWEKISGISPMEPQWRQYSVREPRIRGASNLLHTDPQLWREVSADCEGFRTGIYDGVRCNALCLERYISLPKDWLPTSKDVDPDLPEISLDYKTWPPNSATLLASSERNVKG